MKNFDNNPAVSMLSSGYTERENKNAENIPAKTETKEPAKEPAQKNKKQVRTFAPMKKENKSEKLLLLLKPSLLEKLKTKAKEFDLSTNELINQILESNV